MKNNMNIYVELVCASLHRIRLNTVCTDWPSLESSCSIETLESYAGYECCSENSHYLYIYLLIYWGICQWSLAKTFLWGSLFWSSPDPEKKVSISRRLCLLFSSATSNSVVLISAWNMPQHEMCTGFEDSFVSSAIWKIMWYSVC